MRSWAKKIFLSTGLICVIFGQGTFAQAQWGHSYGGHSSGGSSGGSSSGRSSGWSTSTKVAVVGGAVLGGYMIYRAYRNFEASRSQSMSESSGRGYRSGRGYSTYDSESYDSSDSGYASYRDQLSPAEKRAQIKKEYAAYKQRNNDVFTAARNSLDEQMSKIQSAQNPQLICASVCSSWKGFKLTATPVALGASTADAGVESLVGECKALGGILTDGLAPNDAGSATISLKIPSNICILNQFTGDMIQNANGRKVAIALHVTDISFVQDGVPVSQKFKMEILKQLNDGMKLTSQFKTEAETLNAIKERDDLTEIMSSFKVISKNIRQGITVLGNKKTGAHEKAVMTLKTIKEGLVHADTEFPLSVDHACGEEWHRVKMSYEMDTTGKSAPSFVTPSLLSLTLDSTRYEGEDNYCVGNSSQAMPDLETSSLEQ